MAINKINLQNFTVFEDLELEFSKGINVIIGQNGTGKTHLLKVLYSFENKTHKFEYLLLADKLSSLFKIDISSKQLLCKNSTDHKIKMKIYLNNCDNNPSYSVEYMVGESLDIVKDPNDIVDHVEKLQQFIFIPAKEMLSHSKGFLAMNNKYKMPFDQTYIDILTNVELPETREISERNQSLLTKISQVIDGTVIYENDTFYIVKNDGTKMEFSLEAEGLRKFGLLWKLIRNGLIEKDTVLFWDEPEANLNPELIPVLVEILLELKKNDVQIFLATHSYNLAKYLEIKRESIDEVLFHNLYKTGQDVASQSSEYFGNLKNNQIIEADASLLDEVIVGNFGE